MSLRLAAAQCLGREPRQTPPYLKADDWSSTSCPFGRSVTCAARGRASDSRRAAVPAVPAPGSPARIGKIRHIRHAATRAAPPLGRCAVAHVAAPAGMRRDAGHTFAGRAADCRNSRSASAERLTPARALADNSPHSDRQSIRGGTRTNSSAAHALRPRPDQRPAPLATWCRNVVSNWSLHGTFLLCTATARRPVLLQGSPHLNRPRHRRRAILRGRA